MKPAYADAKRAFLSLSFVVAGLLPGRTTINPA
jgi:hypothetical protein